MILADALSISINLLLVAHVVISLLLILVVLMQRPKQEGLGAAFGGGMTDQMFGAQTTNVLQKGTVYLGTLFVILSLVLAILIGNQNNEKAIAAPAPVAVEEAPAVPDVGAGGSIKEELEGPAEDADATPPADADATPPADADATTPADADATTPADADATTPADADATTPADADATTPADADATTPADTDATTPADSSGSSEPDPAGVGEDAPTGDGVEDKPE